MRLDRLSEMEHYIYQRGSVSLEELASHFGVSINTVRRDISEILKNKSIKKVYGGVMATPPTSMISKNDREKSNTDAKDVIGKLAAEAIQDNSTVFIDTGTTASRIIPHLASKQNITIITNSLTVIEQVPQYPNLSLFSLGGFYNREVAGFVGISVTDCLNRLSFDTAIMSVYGISGNNYDLTIDGFFEEPIKRHVLSKSQKRVILVADTGKFGKSALFSFGSLKDVDYLVMEKEAPAPYREKLEELDLKMVYPGSPDQF